jgi:hypothetical protein
VRGGLSNLQERFSDEALMALYEKIPMLHVAPMGNYLSVDKILKDWQEFDTVRAAEIYCGIKMIYITMPLQYHHSKTLAICLIVITH